MECPNSENHPEIWFKKETTNENWTLQFVFRLQVFLLTFKILYDYTLLLCKAEMNHHSLNHKTLKRRLKKRSIPETHLIRSTAESGNWSFSYKLKQFSENFILVQ